MVQAWRCLVGPYTVLRAFLFVGGDLRKRGLARQRVTKERLEQRISLYRT